MTFAESVKMCLLQKPFTFSGRASRSEYWWFYLFVIIVAAVTTLLGPLGNFIDLLFIGPQLAVTCRRLHDVNHSGWLQAIPFLIGVLYFVGLGTGSSALVMVFMILFLAGCVFLLYLCCRKSHPGTNKYGTNPFTDAGEAPTVITLSPRQYSRNDNTTAEQQRPQRGKIDLEKSTDHSRRDA